MSENQTWICHYCLFPEDDELGMRSHMREYHAEAMKSEGIRDNTEPTEVRSAEGSLSKSPTSIEELILNHEFRQGEHGRCCLRDVKLTSLIEAEKQKAYSDGYGDGIHEVPDKAKKLYAIEELKELLIPIKDQPFWERLERRIAQLEKEVSGE